MALELYRIHTGDLRCKEHLILDPGSDAVDVHLPDYSFLIKHPGKGRVVVWDTGLATDLDIYPPAAKKSFSSFNPTPPQKSLKQICESNGIRGEDVTDVIFSHCHWDHMQPIHGMFPNATAWLGPGTLGRTGKGWPTDPDSSGFSEICDPEKRIGKVHELSFDEAGWTSYPPFDRAFGRLSPPPDQTIDVAMADAECCTIDFFGDGSLLLCDAPGHVAGNLCAVVATEKGKAILGGDCAHHMKLIDGSHRIGHWARPADGKSVSMHDDEPKASKTMAKLKQLKNEGHVLMLAHDGDTPWDKTLA